MQDFLKDPDLIGKRLQRLMILYWNLMNMHQQKQCHSQAGVTCPDALCGVGSSVILVMVFQFQFQL